MSDPQLIALATTFLAYSWLAFSLGRNHERDSRRSAFVRTVRGAVTVTGPRKVVSIDEARGLRGRKVC